MPHTYLQKAAQIQGHPPPWEEHNHNAVTGMPVDRFLSDGLLREPLGFFSGKTGPVTPSDGEFLYLDRYANLADAAQACLPEWDEPLWPCSDLPQGAAYTMPDMPRTPHAYTGFPHTDMHLSVLTTDEPNAALFLLGMEAPPQSLEPLLANDAPIPSHPLHDARVPEPARTAEKMHAHSVNGLAKQHAGNTRVGIWTDFAKAGPGIFDTHHRHRKEQFLHEIEASERIKFCCGG